jgi:hypothetical protein
MGEHSFGSGKFPSRASIILLAFIDFCFHHSQSHPASRIHSQLFHNSLLAVPAQGALYIAHYLCTAVGQHVLLVGFGKFLKNNQLSIYNMQQFKL